MTPKAMEMVIWVCRTVIKIIELTLKVLNQG